MRLKFHQQGMTPISLAALLGLLAFVVLIVLTVAPVYMENFNVKSHLDRIGKDPRTKAMSKEEIRKTLLKRFGIDDVKSVDRTDIFIKESGGNYVIEVDYEVRKEFVGNIDLVIYFTETTGKSSAGATNK